MSEIESQMAKRVLSRVNKYKEAMQMLDSSSFYHHFMLCTKYLVMFDSPNNLEQFEKMNYSNFKIPSKELRQKIIDNMFDGVFNYETQSVFEFSIDEMFVNIIGNLNGGAIMTLVDILTGISGVLTSKVIPMSVSASVTTHFLKTAFEGEKIYVKCQTDRKGRRLIFYSCELYNNKFKKIAIGSHVMAVVNNIPKLGSKPTSKTLFKGTYFYKVVVDDFLI
jgi:uncharacterized protein (TIGR00369 family)